MFKDYTWIKVEVSGVKLGILKGEYQESEYESDGFVHGGPIEAYSIPLIP